jgi:hypothetical protein
MSVISTCIEPGCTTWCIGLFCIKHDAQPQVEFPRGRPWPPRAVAAKQAIGPTAVRVSAPNPLLATAVRPGA